jgi:hypothetical protein
MSFGGCDLNELVKVKVRKFSPMRHLLFSFSFLLVSLQGLAQTRVFVSAGGSFIADYEPNTFFFPGIGNSVFQTDGSYDTKGLGKYWTLDIEVERKVAKYFFVSGLHLFNSGYSNSRDTNFSSLQCSHLGVPLMLRINMLNYCYADVGLIGIFNLNATLEETALKGSARQKYDKQNIAPYLSPFKAGLQLQYSIVINRYFITAYFTKLRVDVEKGLNEKWGLGGSYRGNSLFLSDMGTSYRFYMMGLKLGVRIK